MARLLLFVWPVLGTCALLVSCSGPQFLSVAIRQVDEEAYRAATAEHPTSPREGYLAWKAKTSGRPIDEVIAADASISTTRNPFQANRDAAAVSQGAVIYQARCLRCHGADARGDGPGVLPGHLCKDFRSFGQRFAVTLHGGAPRAWFRKISEGSGPYVSDSDGPVRVMPAFGETLAREQIWLVITYLQSLDLYAPSQPDERR